MLKHWKIKSHPGTQFQKRSEGSEVIFHLKILLKVAEKKSHQFIRKIMKIQKIWLDGVYEFVIFVEKGRENIRL